MTSATSLALTTIAVAIVTTIQTVVLELIRQRRTAEYYSRQNMTHTAVTPAESPQAKRSQKEKECDE